tara:strand:+ start:3178 stop:3726 length:549 start_codon:yes stop_codon:yes gene_type:complete
MKKLLIILLFFPVIGFGQTHSIDTMNLEMIGTTLFNNISSNTYYNTNDSCVVSWSVIDISIPTDWEFSFCFPNCYNIGQVSGQGNFIPEEQIFLGCNFFPNGVPGFGRIKLEIITNGLFKDTVIWNGKINSLTEINEKSLFRNKEINKVYDVFGRTLNSPQKNKFLFYLYNDGVVEKRIVIK